LALAGNIHAQKGPFDPEPLPPTINPACQVHFVTIDGLFQAPNSNWLPCLETLTGGDHTTAPVTVGGHTGVSVSGIKFNNAASAFAFWADKATVDILMQVTGDGAFVDEKGRLAALIF